MFDDQDWRIEFATWLESQDLSGRTVESYGAALDVFAKWWKMSYNRPFAPRELTARDVIGFRDELQNVRSLGASSINVSLSALRKLAKWCVETGQLSQSPVQVKFIDMQEPAPRWMQRGELRRLLAEFERTINDARARNAHKRLHQGVRDLAAIGLMAGAGLRINEVAQLDFPDLTLMERKTSVLVRNGKGRKQRVVPLSPEARRLLLQWLEMRGHGAGPLFASQKNRRMDVRQLQRSFAEKARRAGVEGYTPHSLRHTFLKQVFDKTGNLGVAQRLAGHARITSTARYVVPSEDELTAAMERVML